MVLLSSAGGEVGHVEKKKGGPIGPWKSGGGEGSDSVQKTRYKEAKYRQGNESDESRTKSGRRLLIVGIRWEDP